VTEATKAAAAKLYERGIELSLASSRPPRSIVPLADALKLSGAVRGLQRRAGRKAER